MGNPESVTRLLVDWKNGNHEALDQLTSILYGELRRLASSYLSREKPGHTLQPTALVHEAYMGFASLQSLDYKDRSHFLAIAARLMRQILIQHARSRGAAKRGGGVLRVPMADELVVSDESSPVLIALDDALNELAKVDERKSQMVEMRYFGGLTREEIAEAMSISIPTVTRQLRLAQAWLYRHATEPQGSAGSALQ